MTTMTSYANGVPSWVDLATPDPSASKKFYGELFGWNYDDEPAEPDGDSVEYAMADIDGHATAGIMEQTTEMAETGMPPAWTTYIAVDDLDASMAKVEPAGGSLMGPAMDIAEAGRMAVLSDPGGAVLCMWKAGGHIGSGIVNEPGAFCWTELITADPAAVTSFYAAVFGWTAETALMATGPYTVFSVAGGNENGIAGAMSPPVEGMPASWGVYFSVADARTTVETARSLGAQVLMETTEMPGVGTLATLMDPHGAAFSIMQAPS